MIVERTGNKYDLIVGTGFNALVNSIEAVLTSPMRLAKVIARTVRNLTSKES